MNKDNYYQTSDLSLATAISMFYPLDSVINQTGQKSLFLFERGNKLDDLIERYWLGELTVEPKDYFNQLRNIKSRLYIEK